MDKYKKTAFQIAESLSQKWFGNTNSKNVMALLDGFCRGIDNGISRINNKTKSK